MNKPISEKQALSRLASLCARSEQCTGDLLKKLRQWGLEEDATARIMAYLTEHDYVDDSRYARFFIEDKLKNNGWGRRKIAQALWKKHVEAAVYEPIFDEIEADEYIEKLRPLLRQKQKSITAKTDYERRMKLIRFALGRGYDMNTIRQCIDTTDIDYYD